MSDGAVTRILVGRCGGSIKVREVFACRDDVSIWLEITGLRKKRPVEIAPTLAHELAALLTKGADYLAEEAA